jgi:hypothetical protein
LVDGCPHFPVPPVAEAELAVVIAQDEFSEWGLEVFNQNLHSIKIERKPNRIWYAGS